MRPHVHGISRHGNVYFGTNRTLFGLFVRQRPKRGPTSYIEDTYLEFLIINNKLPMSLFMSG